VTLVAVLAAVAALALTAAPAGAADVGTLQSQVARARDQARSLAASVQLRTAEAQAAAGRAAAAGRRQQQLEAALVVGRARLARVKAAAAVAHQRLLAAQARYRRTQGLLATRLVAIYKSDVPDLATVLLESDGFSDLLTRTAYLKEINDADNALVKRVEALRDGVRSWLARVRELRSLAANQVIRMTSARDEVSRIRAEAEARTAALQRARAAQQSSLAALRSRIAGWTAQVAALQAASGQGGNAGQTVGKWFGDFAIPQSVVMCESGGNYGAVNPNSGAGGAYQFLPDTYKGLGGRYGAPQAAPKWEQDQLAAKLWNGGAGAGNWECAK
jgi:septal ring factor EnvC (AmiA/AmiB activator)